MTKTAAEIRKEIKERSKRRGGGKWSWMRTLKAGDTVYLRIGPPWKKNGEFWKDAFIHGYFKNKVYCRKNDINPKTGKKRKCPVCEELKALKSNRSRYGKKLWGLIRQGSEGLWNVAKARKFKRLPNGKVIVKRYEDDKFKILRLTTRWNNLMMDIFGDEDYRVNSVLGVTHPKYGRLVKVKRTGSGADDTNYSFTPVDRPTPIFKSQEKREKLLKTLVNLDEVVHGSSQEECESFLERCKKQAKRQSSGEREGRDDDDDEDIEEEDDDIDDEESSDDDDDMEAAYDKLKKKKKKKKHREDDDEDDE